jgi:uncharacterized protein YkwD
MRFCSIRLSPPRLLFCAVVALLIAISIGPRDSVRAQAKDGDGTPVAKQPFPGEPPCPVPFSDVRSSDYFYEPVGSLYCSGAIQGYADNTFRPYNPTTRAQLSKIIVLAEGFPLDTTGGPHFSDVPSGSAFYAYVETAFRHGLVTGYSDGRFRPNDLVTRGQLTKVVVVANGWPLVSPPVPTFRDVQPGSPYYTYVETAVTHAIVSGYGDGTFRLGGSATRGQICKIEYAANHPLVLTAEEQATISIINQRRAAMGLGALRVNLSLTSASRRHSNDIGPHGLCQHNGTDGSSPWDRIAQAGYTGGAMGEVVGCGYTTPLGVVDGWWGSPGHYAILTDPNANDVGCGWWISGTGAGWQTCDTGHSN